MPKSGKTPKRVKTTKSPNTVETDPLVHTATPAMDLQGGDEFAEFASPSDAGPSRLPTESSATPSMPVPLGEGESSATPYDDPPGFASEVERDLRNFPAAAGRSARSSSDDAWSGFDDGATGGSWGVSSASVVEELPREPGEPPAGRGRSSADAAGAAGAEDDAFMQAPLEHVPRVKLVAVSGAEAGREFFMRDREMGVGRGAENDVILPDPSVSREHARLVFEAGQFTLVDLQSGNGTFVNGQKISRQSLRHGDEIVFGNVAFRFSDGDAAPLPRGDVVSGRRASRPNLPNRGWRTVAVFMTLLAVAVTLSGALYLRRYGGPHGSERRREQMFDRYAQGVEAFKGRHWDQAEEQFTVAVGLDPENLRAHRYLKAIARERLAEAQWGEALQARKRGDLARSNTLALGILDSSFRAEAQGLLHEIDTECEGRLARGQQLLSNGQPLEAMQMLQSVDSVRPGRPDVAEMLVRANLKGGIHHVLPASLANRSSRRRAAMMTGPLAEAHRAFISGDVEPALQTLDTLNSEDAAAMRSKIEKFREAYRGGMNEHKLKRPAAAIRMLGEAKTLEAQISGGASKLLDDLDRKLADMYYLQGTQSLAANDLPQAYQSLRNAANLTPDYAPASQRLSDLARKAQQMFDSAGREPDVQKARSGLQAVLQIVATESELYRKAKQRLDALPP